MPVYPDVEKGVFVVYGIRLTHDPSFEYRYVGLTTVGASRFKTHISSSKNPKSRNYDYQLSRWFRKHYFNVTFDILEEAVTFTDLKMNEIKWVHILKSRGHRLFNLTGGGEGLLGWNHSQETRNKIALANIGNKHSLGHSHSESTKKRISESRKGIRFTQEHREKLAEASKGNHSHLGHSHSEETKALLSKLNKGKTNKGHCTRWHVNRGITIPDCTFCLTETPQGGTLDTN